MFYILFAITLIGLFTLPFFIKTFLPDYIVGIVPAQLAVISGLFSGLGLSLYTALITIKKFKLLSILLLLKALLFYSMIYFFGLKYSLLYGVSIGLLISETLFFTILVSCALKNLKKIDVK
jgi:O-antigen/teichoic acid export membrane protein